MKYAIACLKDGVVLGYWDDSFKILTSTIPMFNSLREAEKSFKLASDFIPYKFDPEVILPVIVPIEIAVDRKDFEYYSNIHLDNVKSHWGKTIPERIVNTEQAINNF